MTQAFTKMEALGNDFMVVTSLENAFDANPAQIALWADRKRGVGFDQLLVLEEAVDDVSDFVYRIFNADGREVAQCGNGARAVTKLLIEKKWHIGPTIRLATKTRIMTARLLESGDVEVDMGAPVFMPREIPFEAETPAAEYVLHVDGAGLNIRVLSMGNPHAVYETADLKKMDVEHVARAIAAHPRFPAGVNVGIMQIMDINHIQLRVLERGAGFTEACGSAACAAVVAARRKGSVGECVRVSQPGGDMTVSWAGLGEPVYATGPANTVYTGVLSISH